MLVLIFKRERWQDNVIPEKNHGSHSKIHLLYRLHNLCERDEKHLKQKMPKKYFQTESQLNHKSVACPYHIRISKDSPPHTE